MIGVFEILSLISHGPIVLAEIMLPSLILYWVLSCTNSLLYLNVIHMQDLMTQWYEPGPDNGIYFSVILLSVRA